MTPEKLTHKRLTTRADYTEKYNTENVNSIITYSVWLIISAAAFVIHWRLNKKYKN